LEANVALGSPGAKVHFSGALPYTAPRVACAPNAAGYRACAVSFRESPNGNARFAFANILANSGACSFGQTHAAGRVAEGPVDVAFGSFGRVVGSESAL